MNTATNVIKVIMDVAYMPKDTPMSLKYTVQQDESDEQPIN